MPFGWGDYTDQDNRRRKVLREECLQCLSAGGTIRTKDGAVRGGHGLMQVSSAFRLGGLYGPG